MDSPPVPSPRVKSPALVDTVVRSRSATATTSRRRGLTKAPSPRDAAARTALEHEVRDDAVELGALVVERLSALAHALLARAERAEVLDSLGHDVAVQAHDDAARGRAADRDVEEDLRVACVELSAFTTGIDARCCLSRIGRLDTTRIDGPRCLSRIRRSGQLEGHGCLGAGSRALLVTLGSAAATAASAAERTNARRAMITCNC